jgi:hypothetical protein
MLGKNKKNNKVLFHLITRKPAAEAWPLIQQTYQQIQFRIHGL